MSETIGVIGLGIMGGAMARNMLEKNMPVVGYDISQPAIERFRDAGGIPLASIQGVVEASSVMLLSLPTEAAFCSVVQAIADAGPKGKTVIELSVMPLVAKEQAHAMLGQAGCVLLDCPVSGTGAQAVVRDLVVFASGDMQAYEQVKPVFEAISRKQIYLGDFGNGSKMKFIANHLVAIHNAAAAEAFTLAEKANIDRHTLYEALQDSAGTSRMFQVRGPLMAKKNYTEPTATIAMFLKDLGIISQFAADLHCSTPLFGASALLYEAAYKLGLGAMDTAAVCQVLENGTDLRSEK